jgi:hypothetical protein
MRWVLPDAIETQAACYFTYDEEARNRYVAWKLKLRADASEPTDLVSLLEEYVHARERILSTPSHP